MKETKQLPWGDDLEAWLEARDAEQVAGDIRAYVAREVAAEQEACAKACEAESVDAEVAHDDYGKAYNAALTYAAKAIRARGNDA